MPDRHTTWQLEVTVFVCGALVMTLEIIGSRILSPFLGSSTYIWTSLIGVILASLSLGYWLGGRIADRKPHIGYLAATVLAASCLVSLTALIKDIVLSFLTRSGLSLEVTAVTAAILLFAPASVCLGFVTPFAVRLRTISPDTTGQTVGRLYALSTLGSIAGTFAAGFVLIPFVGSVRTLCLIAGGLLVNAVLVVPAAVSRTKVSAIVLLVLAVAATEGSAFLLRRQNDLHDIDTQYSRVQVFRTTDPITGRAIRALATDPYFVQSAAFLDSDELVLRYSWYYRLIDHITPRREKLLLIGGAGYSYPKEFLRTSPTGTIDVVEIDPQMTEIARRFFRLPTDPRLSIYHTDGRLFLNGSADDRYHAVLVDAFGSLFSIPTHLTTVEAVKHLNRIVTDDGVVMVNIGSAITGDASCFLRAQMATYRAVFPNVYLFRANPALSEEKLQNLILVATPSHRPITFTSDDPAVAGLLANHYPYELPPDEPVLTDDLAPVERCNSIAQNVFLTQRELP